MPASVPPPRDHKSRTAQAQTPSRLLCAEQLFGVRKIGRMSFGTVFFHLVERFCTSGRMTTYFRIQSLARA